MRVRLIIAVTAVFFTLLLGVSCAKTSYKSYTCSCVEVQNGVAGEITDYGIQAESRVNAGSDCDDIENRVNNHSQETGSARTTSCTVK